MSHEVDWSEGVVQVGQVGYDLGVEVPGDVVDDDLSADVYEFDVGYVAVFFGVCDGVVSFSILFNPLLKILQRFIMRLPDIIRGPQLCPLDVLYDHLFVF